ncbi:hypothetical protein QT17_01980 [Thermus sp. 2.9]|uniref:hypothetical protein n=1 Tax=Thermus sp. (strain 2.9) TaxID=1577051 RepID=UPI000543F9CF|nr:hypothetical protein [Thermus sp. 2.9]KHG66105.1 hypothetical protein QT17_01980 [Thermus sp. 2.9]
MNETQARVVLAAAIRNVGIDPLTLPAELKPSAWLQGKNLEAYVNEAQAAIQAGVWRGGPLPHGYPAPAEAEPGACYWIMTPEGSVIFQYGSSPYSPDTPGLAPGALTAANAEAAMRAHVRALAEQAALARLAQEYVAWVAGQML